MEFGEELKTYWSCIDLEEISPKGLYWSTKYSRSVLRCSISSKNPWRLKKYKEGKKFLSCYYKRHKIKKGDGEEERKGGEGDSNHVDNREKIVMAEPLN